MNRLKVLREMYKESQADLAKYLGIAPTTVTNWESGFREMDNATLCKIADRYNVSIDYLIGRDYDTKSLSSKEQRIIRYYRNSHPKQKEIIDTLVIVLESDKTNKKSE
jgi:transcriptional regulator with XRE-family HTH domain